MTHEPVRLLNDPALGAALRRDLGAVAHVDVGYDVSAGLARFEANLAAGTGVTTKSAGLSGGAIVGAALLLAGGLTAAALLWLPGTGEAPTSPTSPAALATAPVAAHPIAAPTTAPTVAPAPIAPESSVELLADDPAPVASPRPNKRPARAKPVDTAAPDQDTTGAATTDVLREARNLQAARGLLGRDAAKALALAEAGAREFKGGTFAQEWEGVAILALFELGRPEARTRGDAFLRTYPSGTYAQRVRQALEN